jgi:endonuclease-3
MIPPTAVRRVARRLAQEYGDARFEGPGDPLSGLVSTILSQNTTAVNTRRAFAALRRRFPSWEEVAAAPLGQIEDAIRPAGLGAQRARRIQKILQHLRDVQGRPSLDFLADLSVEEARDFLLTLPGVGPKTAACVLLFELGREVFPVDTHVYRICRRLGWLEGDPGPDRAHQILEPQIPGSLRYSLHVNMVRHGRARCRPHRPRCHDCPLRPDCRWNAENGLGKAASAGENPSCAR